jgi:copper homeostasis protein CutC
MQGTLEVPVDALAAALDAAPCVDRLELCSDLASEGWTPDVKLVRTLRDRTACELVAMIRPRLTDGDFSLTAAGFRATPARLEASLEQVASMAGAGAHSVAIGLLDEAGDIDLPACASLRDAARRLGLGVSFHRAFDLVVDRERGLHDLVALGVRRVLTAGVHGWDTSARTVADRTRQLERDRHVLERVASRHDTTPPDVVACGGVRADNAAAWLAVTPHLHASCRLGGAFDHDQVRRLREILPA